MKTLKIKLLSLFVVLSGILLAQNFPVQTTIQLTPPFTSYLPDYTDGVNSKLQVGLNIKDVNEPMLQVKLKISLEGPGGRIVTNPNFVQTPITLNFGTPLVLSGSQLSPYLAADNLLFPSEEFKQNYIQTKVLPEGLWQLCIEVEDATNPEAEVLSTNNCALLFVARLQAPILNLPLCDNIIPRAQNVFFTWTDMALGSHLAGNEPLYEFSLYSVPSSAYNNPSQVLNTVPIYQETTNITSLNIDTNNVMLLLGQKYLWQVRAVLPDGSAAYLNNGYSAPCTFDFGDIAQEVIDDLTINLTANATGPTSGQASWTLSSSSGSSLSYDDYIIAYRKAGNDNYFWFEQPVDGFNFDINQLEEETTYEVKILGLIKGKSSDYTSSVTFTTPAYPNYACGDGTSPVQAPNYTPLPVYNAISGIEIQQGQFQVDITSIEANGNGDGHYSGTGQVQIPFLLMSINVEFDDILIDDEYIVRSGTINAIATDLDEWIDDGLIDAVDPILVDGTITNGSINLSDSTATVTTTEGTFTYDFEGDLPIVVQDEDFNEWIFWPDGRIVKKTNGIIFSADNLDATKDKHIRFEADAAQVYPFDKIEYFFEMEGSI